MASDNPWQILPAYNLKRVMQIFGVAPLVASIRA